MFKDFRNRLARFAVFSIGERRFYAVRSARNTTSCFYKRKNADKQRALRPVGSQKADSATPWYCSPSATDLGG